ncbi:MAG: helix-turn-helix transcriptional regulator [Clostridia bacterium]|nr:helix-turn-helix transcriptional regulator [Clostridia bacterium]
MTAGSGSGENHTGIPGGADMARYIRDHKNEFIEKRPLHHHLQNLMNQKALTKREILDRTDIEKSYLYQIFSGRRMPGRDKLLRICIAMELGLDDVQRCLIYANKAILFSEILRDAVLITCFENGHDLHKTQETLYDLGLDTLI